MKKRNHKLLAILIALIALVVLCTFAASSEIVGGDCGYNGNPVTWSYNTETKILTISGEGVIYSSPWLDSYSDEIQSVVIEEGITEIMNPVFENCSSMTSISLPNTLIRIKDGTFANCSLESITIPPNVTSAPKLFTNGSSFSSLKSVELTDGLKAIDMGMFLLTQLEEIVIPSSVESIGTLAFACPHIQSVYIGTGIKEIGYAAMNVDMWHEMSGGALNFQGPDTVHICMTEEEWQDTVTIHPTPTSETYAFGNVNYPECNWVSENATILFDSHLPGEPVEETVPANGATPAHTDRVTRCTLCGKEISREPIEILPGHEHAYAAIFTWSEDGTMANAVVACSGCNAASGLLNAEITREAKADGSILCTATVEYADETFTDTKTVQPAESGDPGLPPPVKPTAFRCGMCKLNDAYKGKGFIGLIVSLVHTFVHLAAQIGAR